MHCIMRRAALTAAILLALQTPAAAAWKRTTLGQGGQYSSIDVDADGNSHISYLAGSNPHFKLNYALFNGKSWRRETVDTGNVGLYSAIAVDSHGHPHIAYAGLGASSMLKYAAFDGTNWTITTLDTGGYSADIVLDTNDHPHISYALSTIGANVPLRYAHHDGSNWIFETISNTMLPWAGSSIALNSAGAAYISFCDQNLNLFLATNASGSWTVGGVHSGWRPSLALDNADRPHIFYVSDAVPATKYAVWTGTMWSFTTLPYGDATSLALDGSGRPHIAFGANTGNQLALTYGTAAGTGFVLVTLSGLDTDHVQTSIAVDALGLPHITSAKTMGNSNFTMRYAQLRLPDIGGSFTNIGRTPVVSGIAVNAKVAVFNLGNLNARAVSVQFYLSDNAVLDAGDTPVGPPRNIGAIGPGKTKLVNFNHTFASAVTGTSLFAVLDAAEKNVETSETNNAPFVVIP